MTALTVARGKIILFFFFFFARLLQIETIYKIERRIISHGSKIEIAGNAIKGKNETVDSKFK